MEMQTVYEKMKTARSLRYMTNCYSPKAAENILAAEECGDSLLLVCEDHGVKRLFFFADSADTVDRLLRKLSPGVYFMEYMTKEPDSFSVESGTLASRLMRFVNSDCTSVFLPDSRVLRYRDDSVGEPAAVTDAAEINALLWSVFKTEVSHLLTDEELSHRIESGDVYIHRGGAIDAILQTEILPKRFYINQVVNKTDPSVIHAIMLKRLTDYVNNGGKYLYSWIEESNIASIKFHEKYGMRRDGMYDLVFRVER